MADGELCPVQAYDRRWTERDFARAVRSKATTSLAKTEDIIKSGSETILIHSTHQPGSRQIVVILVLVAVMDRRHFISTNSTRRGV
jgi:hypothetical protein